MPQFECSCSLKAPLSPLLDAGPIPVSNGFLSGGEAAERKNLILGRCEKCRLLQLLDPYSESDLVEAIPSWVRYGEPEAHLDEVTDILMESLSGISEPLAAGLSYIDDSMRKRLKKKGVSDGGSIDLLNGAPMAERWSLERVLLKIRENRLNARGVKFDLLCARHVLDHCRDLEQFFSFARECLNDDGLLFLEVPDSDVFLRNRDPLMLWESHASYFTKHSLEELLALNGFGIRHSERFEAGPSAVLTVVCEKSPKSRLVTAPPTPADDQLIQAFVREFEENRGLYSSRLAEIRKHSEYIAMFGGGHLGSLFLNLFDLAGYLDFVVDDDPKKDGFTLPGTNLPILSTDAILKKPPGFVLMAVNPAVEEKVVAQLCEKRPGLEFGSIYVSSPRSLIRNERTHD